MRKVGKVAIVTPQAYPDLAQPLAGVGRVVLLSVLAGFALTVVWSYTFVDSVIGDNVANTLLGYEAKGVQLTGPMMGVIFAFVSGLAGTFTACNIACFGAVAPLIGQGQTLSRREELAAVLRPIGWLTLGVVAVSGVYGAVGALMGPSIPQLSLEVTAAGMPIRLVQSAVVFGVVGLAFVYLGLVSLQIVPDALAHFRERHPRTDVVVIGGLIGAFLIGRPFQLFFKMFEYAASTHNPVLGASTFVLQAVGNIVVMVGLFLVLFYAGGGRFRRWLSAKPGRIQRFTATALISAGTFTVLYWVLRVPSIFGYFWWPTAPWN